MSNGKYVDLHLHSRHSDGIHSPAGLVAMAADKGLAAIAIADHDSVAGIDEALEAGARLGVEVIPAVELSVSYKGMRDVHLLGYLIDHRDPGFAAMLEEFRKSRDDRGRAILERINSRLAGEKKKGLDYGEVQAVAGGAMGRPHIARILMKNGHANSMEDAFEKYLVPCNVPKFHIHVADAIAEIKRIGGVAVLAHPPSISKNFVTVRTIIRSFSEMGLDGLELLSNMCYKEDIINFNALAGQLGLIVTGGTDYHGFNAEEEMGNLRGGTKVPYELVEGLRGAQALNFSRMNRAPALRDKDKRQSHG